MTITSKRNISAAKGGNSRDSSTSRGRVTVINPNHYILQISTPLYIVYIHPFIINTNIYNYACHDYCATHNHLITKYALHIYVYHSIQRT
jgi:hypothetical protein